LEFSWAKGSSKYCDNYVYKSLSPKHASAFTVLFIRCFLLSYKLPVSPPLLVCCKMLSYQLKRLLSLASLNYCGPYSAPIRPSCMLFNPLKPNDAYRGRTAPLTSKITFYIFIQPIWVLNILNMVYTLRFFLFKMQFVS
jgi:hypothetical protein